MIQLPWQAAPDLSVQPIQLPPDLQPQPVATAAASAPPQSPAPSAPVAAPAPVVPMAPAPAPTQQAQPVYPGLKKPPPPVGTTVNGLTYMGGDPRSTDPSVWRPASGDTFLNSLPIDDEKKTLVKAIANYDLPPGSQRGGLGSPEVQQLLSLAKQYDPTFSASDYAVRQGIRTDFAKGKYSQTVTALNTAIDHANLLANDAKTLNNYGSPAINWIRNKFDSNILGDPRQGNFQQVARNLGGEVTKAVTGGQGGEQDRQDSTNDYQLNGTPTQQNQALAQTVSVLKSKLDELNNTYQRGMGPKANVIELLSPTARKSWMALNQQFVAPASGEAAAPAPAAGPITPQSLPRITPPAKVIRFQDLQ